MSLPKHVYAVKDRHGKIRYRFRKRGLPSPYLPLPTSPDFDAAYKECFNPAPRPERPPRPKRRDRRRRLVQYRGLSLVYFIGIRGGLVKIGRTVNLPERLKKLQTGAPAKLRLLAVVEGDASLEVEYHSRFADLRQHGEWFRNAGPLHDEIERLRGLSVFQPAIPSRFPTTSQQHEKVA